MHAGGNLSIRKRVLHATTDKELWAPPPRPPSCTLISFSALFCVFPSTFHVL